MKSKYLTFRSAHRDVRQARGEVRYLMLRTENVNAVEVNWLQPSGPALANECTYGYDYTDSYTLCTLFLIF
jgi:hypothetical protein